MLNTLKLTNFRRHEDLSIDFTSGINIIRAANEGGKSTMLESILYALFGSRTLRTPIEQTVTWGEDPKTLKVELTLTAGNRLYLFKRSKAGAEVILDGRVFCTGQNEVSAVAETLLGTDATTAQNLLMASQGSIRGALEQGPKALSALIEHMSSMEVFDQILEAAQERLALGSPNLLEERLKGANATLAAATERLPPKPDDEAHASAVLKLAMDAAAVEVTYPTLDAARIAANDAWIDASALYLRKSTLRDECDRASQALDSAKATASSLASAAGKTFDPTALEVLKQRVTHAEDHTKRRDAYKVFTALPEGPRFAGDWSKHETATDEATGRLDATIQELAKVNSEIADWSRKRINHDKCDKCGQDVTHLNHVKSTNATVDANLALLTPRVLVLEKDVAKQRGELAALHAVRKHADRLRPEFQKLHGYVGYNTSTFPNTAVWVGEIPGDDVPDLAHARRQLAEALTNIKLIEAAQVTYKFALSQVAMAEIAYDEAVKAHANFEAPDADEVVRLTDAKDQAVLALTSAWGRVDLINREIAEMERSHTAASCLWIASKARIDDAQRIIDECQKDLASLAFNNSLIKKLRTIRPFIANKLWSTVLASVSVMFSQMRGEESWVSKEKSGFCVNGQAVESLSGSTLDVLGLAIRCSLLRTFLPQCGLLVLDEPCAAMDEGRTEALLGFLKSVDFQQTLMVSHETVSESIADNLIQL